MKKKIFSIAAVVLFMSTNVFASLSSAKEEAIEMSCEDMAWDAMERVYDQSHDGFLAAKVMEAVLENCID
ncbi:hypothetical protein [Cellulophaga fucicola]|uniref:hypothetical protein n=1 Tax=Cellulophaga fucicola TaxID=76595 RepID=UPI003EB6CFEE